MDIVTVLLGLGIVSLVSFGVLIFQDMRHKKKCKKCGRYRESN